MSTDTWTRFVESVSSAIMPFKTPIFPLRKPAAQRLVGRSGVVSFGFLFPVQSTVVVLHGDERGEVLRDGITC